MNTAEKIFEEAKILPVPIQEEVLDFIQFLQKKKITSLQSEFNNDPIKNFRGRARGEKLVEKLLKSRQEDQHQ